MNRVCSLLFVLYCSFLQAVHIIEDIDSLTESIDRTHIKVMSNVLLSDENLLQLCINNPNTKELDLSDHEEVIDITKLSALQDSLECLILSNTNIINSNAIRHFNSLQKIYLSETTIMDDIEAEWFQ